MRPYSNAYSDKTRDKTRAQESLGDESKTTPNALIANCSRLNIRETPDIKSKVVSVVKLNTEVITDGVIGEWAHIRTDTINGYVMTKYLDILI